MVHCVGAGSRSGVSVVVTPSTRAGWIPSREALSMDRNTILAIALSIAVYSLWLGYQASQDLPEPMDDATRQEEAAAALPGAADDARVIADREAGLPSTLPSGGAPEEAAAERRGEQGIETGRASQVAPWTGSIEGKRFDAKLSNRGATLIGWTLREYEVLDNGGEPEPVQLVNIEPAMPGALSQAFVELGFGDLGQAYFEVEEHTRDRVVFVLERGGITVRKSYVFDLEGYGFELLVDVENDSNHLIAPDFAVSWPAVVREGNDYKEQSLVVLHSEDLERELVSSVGGSGFLGFGASDAGMIWRGVSWAGVDLKYFASLLLPESGDGASASFQLGEEGRSASTELRYAPSEIAPGQAARRSWTTFLGPKQPELLEAMGRGLSKSVDLGYSWFEPLTSFFQWLLHTTYEFIPNYGFAIIVITILVRLLTLPIMNRQMRSMEKMRALQPRMKEIQEEHKDDRQKQSEATMALYKETGVNPLGGCLPMLLQFPVFIGLFFALQSSFDLRQAEFILWIDDLSAPDMLFMIPGLDFPFRLLPIIMGGSMILQQKLTPTTVDPSQQMMMMVMMPVMMTVLFYQFPSGLVLYWMVSNFLGIAHQMLVGRRMKAAEASA